MAIQDFFKRKTKKAMPKNTDDAYIKLTEQYRVFYGIDVKKWRSAHQAAISAHHPTYVSLMDVYEDALLDTHLSAKLQSRTLNVLNTPFRLRKGNDIDMDLTKLFNKRWMFKLIQEIVYSVYHGYSGIKWLYNSKGFVYDIESIDRRHFVPQRDQILPNVLIYGNGIDITHPPYCYTYSLIKHNSLGLLLECAKYTIFKKHATAHWQQLQQLFGIPMRIGRTNSGNKAVMDKVFTSLKNMGAAGYGVFPLGTDIEIKETGKNDPYRIFQEAINTCNQELSMRVMGTPETTDKEGSFAREKVNYDRHNDLTLADLRYVEFIINDQILPILNMWAYDLNDVVFEFDPSWSLPLAESQLEVDRWLLENFDLSPEYIEETYGVPVQPKAQPATPDAPIVQKKKVSQPITTKATSTNDGLTGLLNGSNHLQAGFDLSQFVGVETPLPVVPDWFEVLIKDIYDNKFAADALDTDGLYLPTSDELWQGVLDNVELDGVTNGSTTANWLLMQQRGIYAFSAAKSYDELLQLRNMVFDANTGQTVPFTEFRANALRLYPLYNEHWLRTEYNGVVRGTITGKAWLNIQRDKDIYPYLRYRTQGDSRVRLSHEKLEGITLPVDSPVWDELYPPNGFNCRCPVPVQLRADELTDKQRAKANADSTAAEAAKLFREEEKDTYWYRNTGKQPMLDYKQTNYSGALPVDVPRLEAVKHYRLPTIEAAKDIKGLTKLQRDEVTLREWFDLMSNGLDGFAVENKIIPFPLDVLENFVEGLKLAHEVQEWLTVEFENIVLSPNEIWTQKDLQTDSITFVKYYADSVVSIVFEKRKGSYVASQIRTNSNDYRKGLLLYKK